MGWNFETDPEFQKELDWITNFVRKEVEPLDHVLGNPYDIHNPRHKKIVPTLQEQVSEANLSIARERQAIIGEESKRRRRSGDRAPG